MSVVYVMGLIHVSCLCYGFDTCQLFMLWVWHTSFVYVMGLIHVSCLCYGF